MATGLKTGSKQPAAILTCFFSQKYQFVKVIVDLLLSQYFLLARICGFNSHWVCFRVIGLKLLGGLRFLFLGNCKMHWQFMGLSGNCGATQSNSRWLWLLTHPASRLTGTHYFHHWGTVTCCSRDINSKQRLSCSLTTWSISKLKMKFPFHSTVTLTFITRSSKSLVPGQLPTFEGTAKTHPTWSQITAALMWF